jgi:hypothetical protein
MAFPGNNYAPPGVFTDTKFENPLAGTLEALKIPVIIGEGNEILYQQDLEIVRGSSASVDQRVVGEDETGRAVVSISNTGVVTRGDFNGVLDRFQVRNFPIVSGDGTGTTTNNRTDVLVTINNVPVVVRSLIGATGLVQLATVPTATDVVRCTYYFDRTDTLITDDVSAQVPGISAQVRAMAGIGDSDAPNPTVPPTTLDLHGDILNSGGAVVVPANNVLSLVVDGVARTLTIPPRTNYTMLQVASAIVALRAGTLSASTFVNQYGQSALLLTADCSLVINNGSANAPLGLLTGQADNRVTTFYTFQGPIVDGTNGGVTTTDPADVTVKVDGHQVIPTAVDGANRAVTLAVAPKAGARVSVQYYFNTWQDTFDYLADINVTQVLSCGDVPGGTGYVQGVDFVLQNDRIVWGTAAIVTAGVNTTGTTIFQDQLTTTLVDDRTFLSECTPIVQSSGGIAVSSTTQFLLPFQPTLGNGRDTPLGQSLFQTIANDRIDVAVNRPDVIWAYWGFGIQDALDRGRVEVLTVDGLTITLKDPAMVGATVYATFYHNRLTDSTYTLSCVIPGISGVGTYTIQDTDENDVIGVSFNTGTKSAGLAGIPIEFPSGSELKSDAHFESVDASTFVGPVEEIVTVQFAVRQATPAKYTATGAGPYDFIAGASDHLRVRLHSVEVVTAAGLNLASPSLVVTHTGGYFASLVSDEIVYTGGTGSTVGENYEVAASEEFTLGIDNVDVNVKTGIGTAKDIDFFRDAINEAAGGSQGLSLGGGAATGTTFKLAAAMPGYAVDDYYVGWKVVLGNGATQGTAGESREITAYNGTTNLATIASSYTLIGFAQQTINLAGVVGGDTVTIGADTYTCVDPGPAAAYEFIKGGTDILSAVALAGAIALQVHPTYAAAAVGGQPQVTVTATAAGLAGEAVTLATAVPAHYTFTDQEGVLHATPTTLLFSYITDPFYVYNPAARAALAGATKFDGPFTVTAGALLDRLNFVYQGSVTGATATLVASLVGAPTTYATAAALATEVQTRIATAVAGAGAAFAGLVIECAANADGQLEFRLQLPGLDNAGFLQFIVDGTPARDFAIAAGIDTGSAVGRGQAALVQGLVARTYKCPTPSAGGAKQLNDRLILRNRVLPGGGGSMAADFVTSLTALEVKSDNDKAGLVAGQYGLAGSAAVVHPASMVGNIGYAGGQAAAGGGEPVVLFYDGTALQAENDTFNFDLDGYPVNVTFTSTPAGTATSIGPVTDVASVMGPIIATMAAVPGAPWGNAAAIINANLIRREGAAFRITSAVSDTTSHVVIGAGLANAVLGFQDGQTALRVTVPTRNLVSALMAHRHATFATWLLAPATEAATSFTTYGFATVEPDATGAEFLYIQDAPRAVANLGAASNVTMKNTTGGVSDALRYGTGLTAVDGDGAVGEAALSGYFVISNVPTGSGTANTSVLNNGVGQDGIVGQTYRDEVTGLTFTILPRNWSTNQTGPWLAYPTGGTFRFNVSKTFLTNANLPILAVNGVELVVSNTAGVGVGDTAIVTTYARSGSEPKVGDLYYTTYAYTKVDFTTTFYTKMQAVERDFGPATPDNPVSLATYLAMLNGAVLVGIKQVQKEANSSQASLTSYRNAISEMEGVLPGFISPDMVLLMRGDSTELFQVLKKSNEKMSSIRYKSERTSIIGMAAGSLPRDAQNLAQNLFSPRMRLVYPDMALIDIQDNLGNSKQYLIDGCYLATMLAGSVVSSNVDVATPWTGRRLVGTSGLARQLDAVEQNQIAVKGVTILEDRPPYLRVRHGLTTDMTNILTKTPTIVQIADEVQRQARSVLEQFVGIKFLPGVLSQIEGRLSMMLKAMVAAQIITAYTGVKANPSADDPTVAEVEAFYSPVFPLLYLVVTFHLRSSI